MSRIGKKLIQIPQGVKIENNDGKIKVNGEKGVIEVNIPKQISVEEKNGEIIVSIKEKEKDKQASAFWGLTRALLQNAVIGVSKGFEKQLEIIGVGYKAKMDGEKVLELSMGYSHPVRLDVPEGLSAKVEKNIITISGIDKQAVGQFSAKVRAVRKPEPYKGKGIKYIDEHIRRKEGKKAAKTTA